MNRQHTETSLPPAPTEPVPNAAFSGAARDTGASPGQEPSSPCIGYCSTSLGDAVCLGCGRSAEEIDQWIVLDEEQKRAIWARINAMDTIRNRR